MQNEHEMQIWVAISGLMSHWIVLVNMNQPVAEAMLCTKATNLHNPRCTARLQSLTN